MPVALLRALVVGLLVAGGPAPGAAATITVDTFAQVDAAKCTLINAINSMLPKMTRAPPHGAARHV